MTDRYCLVFTTTNDKVVVDSITKNLLELQLSACIQIDNIESYFTWDGKITSSKEYRLIIKAKSNDYKKIEEVIINIHNYKLPEIIKLGIDDGLPAYLNWLGSFAHGNF